VSEWEWVSTGEDSLCDDRAGIHYGGEPTRPHPHCVCEIHEVADDPTLTTNWGQLSLDGLTYESTGTGTFDYKMRFVFNYVVHCSDGTGRSAQLVIERDYAKWTAEEGAGFENTDALYDEVFNEALAQLQAIAQSICPGDGPPLLV